MITLKKFNKLCTASPVFSRRALLSFSSAAFTEIAGILSATVGTGPALWNALLNRYGIALQSGAFQYRLRLSHISCEGQYSLIRYRSSAFAAGKGAYVCLTAGAAAPWGSLDGNLHNLLFTGIENRGDRSRRIVLPVNLALTSNQSIV